MKLKYKVRQLRTGKWAVWANKTKYFTGHVYETEIDAIKASLVEEGWDSIRKLDDVQARMETIPGMIDERDPYAWRC